MTITTLIWLYSGSVYGTVEIYISEKDRNNKFCPACSLLRTLAERWSYINQNLKMSSWKNEWGAVKAERRFRQMGRTQHGNQIFLAG